MKMNKPWSVSMELRGREVCEAAMPEARMPVTGLQEADGMSRVR